MQDNKVFQNKLILILIFIIVGFGVYWNSFNNPFEGDDLMYVVNNGNIQTLKNIPLFFMKPRMLTADPLLAGHYRPLVVLSYAVNYAIGGLSPVSYHVTNLMFHIGTAFLVFLIVNALLVNSERSAVSSLVALAAGIIFLVHPFNSEAVNYITARSSVMSGFFYLLGLWCWVKFRQGSSYFYMASFLAFIAGMLSKEVVITLPVMFWLYDRYWFNRVTGQKTAVESSKSTGYLSYLPFILVVVIPYILVRLFTFGGVLTPGQKDLPTQIFTEAPVLWKYWRMFILPTGLSLVHDADIIHTITFIPVMSVVFLLVYIGIAIYLFYLRDNIWRITSYFMLWFLIVLLPTTLISLNAVFQENRGYLAIISFAVIAGLILKSLEKAAGRKFMLITSAVIILVYSFGVLKRNNIWADVITFNADAVRKAPNSTLSYTWLARAYLKNGEDFLALETAKKGVLVDPDNYGLRILLGAIYKHLNRTDDAIEEFKQASRLNPAFGALWNELSTLYYSKGDISQAEIYIREGIKHDNNYPSLYYNLGKLLAKQGKINEGLDMFEKAISLRPSYLKARLDSAEALKILGRKGDAELQYREIIRIGTSQLSDRSSMSEEDRSKAEIIVEMARRQLNNGE